MARPEATQPTPVVVEPAPPTFTSIAPEIRNRIFDLVLYSFDTETQTDLLQATPPSKALLLTCRKLYEEAKYT